MVMTKEEFKENYLPYDASKLAQKAVFDTTLAKNTPMTQGFISDEQKAQRITAAQSLPREELTKTFTAPTPQTAQPATRIGGFGLFSHGQNASKSTAKPSQTAGEEEKKDLDKPSRPTGSI